MLLHGKRAALSHFFRHFKLHSTSKNTTHLTKPLIINNLPPMHQLPKCLAYLRKLFPRRKINERFVRFFHSKITDFHHKKNHLFDSTLSANPGEKSRIFLKVAVNTQTATHKNRRHFTFRFVYLYCFGRASSYKNCSTNRSCYLILHLKPCKTH